MSSCVQDIAETWNLATVSCLALCVTVEWQASRQHFKSTQFLEIVEEQEGYSPLPFSQRKGHKSQALTPHANITFVFFQHGGKEPFSLRKGH